MPYYYIHCGEYPVSVHKLASGENPEDHVCYELPESLVEDHDRNAERVQGTNAEILRRMVWQNEAAQVLEGRQR